MSSAANKPFLSRGHYISDYPSDPNILRLWFLQQVDFLQGFDLWIKLQLIEIPFYVILFY